jgi:hypothetical protein
MGRERCWGECGLGRLPWVERDFIKCVLASVCTSFKFVTKLGAGTEAWVP